MRFRSASNGKFGVFWLSDEIVWKLAELRIYTFSGKNVAQKRSCWQYKIYADIRGSSLERGRQISVVAENDGHENAGREIAGQKIQC